MIPVGFTRALRRFASFILVCVWASAYPAIADDGGTLKVQCGGTGPVSTITGALKLLSSKGPSTLIVSGACSENVLIQGFDRLTLQAATGASISDASGGSVETLAVGDSRSVTVQGFTINGAVACANGSNCFFKGNRILGQDGVVVVRSHANFEGDVIEGGPLSIIQSARAVATGVTVRGSSDVGIIVRFNAFLRLEAGSVVTESASDGIAVGGVSSLLVARGNSITGNAGAGVSVGELSFAEFRGDNLVAGNAGPSDVVCGPQFSVTRGALIHIGGGTTNCLEP
jgi:hypothetical protein